jgi:hypothetical protein
MGFFADDTPACSFRSFAIAIHVSGVWCVSGSPVLDVDMIGATFLSLSKPAFSLLRFRLNHRHLFAFFAKGACIHAVALSLAYRDWRSDKTESTGVAAGMLRAINGECLLS